MASDPHMDEQNEGPGQDPFLRESVEWPSGAPLIRQVVIVLAAALLWGGAFRVAMNLPTETVDLAAEERRAERRRAAMEAQATADSTSVVSETASDADGAMASNGTPAGSGAGDQPAQASPEIVASAPSSATPQPATPSTRTTASPPPASSSPASSSPQPVGTEDPIAAMDDDEDLVAQLPDLNDLPTVSFAGDVMPILERRCVSCHGGIRDDGSLRIEEGLDMRTHQAILAGSTWGSVVEPGDPVASYMLELVLKGDMPNEGPRLLPGEIRILTAWIQSGAANNQ